MIYLVNPFVSSNLNETSRAEECGVQINEAEECGVNTDLISAPIAERR